MTPAIQKLRKNRKPFNGLFPKWTRVINLMGVVGPAISPPDLATLTHVHRLVNQVPYAPDREMTGLVDYWQAPSEFWKRGAGDCEDYAIAKYFMLLEAGFRDDDLDIAVVVKRISRELHALLLVNLGGDVMVLDNESESVKREEYLQHFKLIYCVNRDGWFLGENL